MTCKLTTKNKQCWHLLPAASTRGDHTLWWQHARKLPGQAEIETMLQILNISLLRHSYVGWICMSNYLVWEPRMHRQTAGWASASNQSTHAGTRCQYCIRLSKIKETYTRFCRTAAYLPVKGGIVTVHNRSPLFLLLILLFLLLLLLLNLQHGRCLNDLIVAIDIAQCQTLAIGFPVQFSLRRDDTIIVHMFCVDILKKSN